MEGDLNHTQSILETAVPKENDETRDKLCFIHLNDRVKKCNLLTLLWLKFLMILAMFTYIVFLPQLIVAHFGKTEKETGHITGNLNFYGDLCLFPVNIFAGLLLDRFGRKYLTIWGFIVYGASIIAYPFSPSIYPGILGISIAGKLLG